MGKAISCNRVDRLLQGEDAAPPNKKTILAPPTFSLLPANLERQRQRTSTIPRWHASVEIRREERNLFHMRNEGPPAAYWTIWARRASWQASGSISSSIRTLKWSWNWSQASWQRMYRSDASYARDRCLIDSFGNSSISCGALVGEEAQAERYLVKMVPLEAPSDWFPGNIDLQTSHQAVEGVLDAFRGSRWADPRANEKAELASELD